MFGLAFLLGIYAYIIFFLGIFGLLYKPLIIGITSVFIGFIILWSKQKIISILYKILRFIQHDRRLVLVYIKNNKVVFTLMILIVLQAFVNIIGVFGPELAFDALWYHLTLPKLYLVHHSIFFIPGGLLYYSGMPKIAEMLYIAGLAFGNETIPKLIHFSFGILICVALYKLSRKFFNPVISWIAVVVFYSNLVVGWESITAYIDLTRTFFEILALWGFINWWENQRLKWLMLSAILVGFSITTKLLAIGSLVIFTVLILMKILPSRMTKNIFLYWISALVIPLPWLIFSYFHTENPVYPFFTHMYPVSLLPVNPILFFKETWNLLTHSSDPLSPLYIIFLPLIIYCYPSFKKEIKLIAWYSLLGIIVWYFTPRTGGGRFIIPYLPAFSMVVAACINEVLQKKQTYGSFFAKFLVALVILVSLISIGYRLAANSKYIPALIGKESKQQFFTTHLNFSYGDFFDTDDYFKNHIKQNDMVLLYGFHNLYYVDFPFIDASWVKKREKFTAIATQNIQLPERFKNWQLVYENKQTMVKLYKPQKGVCKKICFY